MKHLFSLTTALCLTAFPAAAQLHFDVTLPEFVRHRDTLTVSVIGDVMMHKRQLEYEHDSFLSYISPAMKDAGICIANMEFALGGRPYSGYPAFSAPDSYADYVRDCGADVFLTANNHILDKGSAGLKRTLAKYRSMEGIRFTGTAETAVERDSIYPLIIRRKNFTIALLNFTYGTNVYGSESWPKVNRMDRSEIKDAIEKAKEKEADFIIALPHWGNEYELRHNERETAMAEWLVREGVDAIVGSHPHVIQDSSSIAGKPVIYSIGNAVSNMSAKFTRLELFVTLRFEYDWFTGEKRQLEPELRLMWCTLPGTLTDSYATIFVNEWTGRRSEWKQKEDYDNMISTAEAVIKETGLIVR